jgi:hypothetical protein
MRPILAGVYEEVSKQGQTIKKRGRLGSFESAAKFFASSTGLGEAFDKVFLALRDGSG